LVLTVKELGKDIGELRQGEGSVVPVNERESVRRLKQKKR
jgi:hypothetical protein